MKTRLQILLLSLIAITTSPGAFAGGIPTFDVANLTQMMQQYQTLTDTLQAAQDQLDQLEQTYQTLQQQYQTVTNMYNEMRGITAHAQMLPNSVAALHSFLPTGSLDPTQLLSGPIAGAANALRTAEERFSVDQLFGGAGPQITGAQDQYEARSDYIYTYMAMAQEAFDRITARRATLEAFATAATTATTEKAILDLNTRIAAENALLLNDIALLQALDLRARMQEQSIDHNEQGLHSHRPTSASDVDFSN